VERELVPHVDEWVAKKEYPMELHQKLFKAGIGGIIYPKSLGGYAPDKKDYFLELIRVDEFARTGGHVLGQEGINSMALPPIISYGSPKLQEMVCRPVIAGLKSCSLAISEPYAGSDVAGIRGTAVRDGKGNFVVNAMKKWCTGGAKADFFTTALRTGDQGMGGVSLLLIPRNLPGVSVRRMETQFDSAHSTAMVTFEDVIVPEEYLIGQEGMGFVYIVQNFNHERWIIAVGANRQSRECYREAFEWAMKREAFGKPLIKNAIIRAKLGDMSRQIESVHDTCERIAFALSNGVPDAALGAQCALLKVQATKTMEFCAREAVQIFGGSGVVREGAGRHVERMYREVRAAAIPGGSEEILLDFAIRNSLSKTEKELKKRAAKL
jgi:alkylation response protein AidB-like acyl-CoA dehydrogenase